MKPLVALLLLVFSNQVMACPANLEPDLSDKSAYSLVLIGDVVGISLPAEALAMRKEEVRIHSGVKGNFFLSSDSTPLHIVSVLIGESLKGGERKLEIVDLVIGGCGVNIPKIMSRGVFFVNSEITLAVFNDEPRRVGDLYQDWVLKARKYAR